MSKSSETKFAFFTHNKSVGDLKSKDIIELKEMLERQNHLLTNKSLINKLQDRGEKLLKAKNEILKEIDSRKQSVLITKSNFNNSSCEWREPIMRTIDSDEEEEVVIENDKDVLTILSENGQVPTKSHNKRLIEKENHSAFHYKPSISMVAEKLKKVIPNAHTETQSISTIKIINLDESLHLLSDQISALQILGNSGRKRAEECVDDRINESMCDDESDKEIENVDEDNTDTKCVSSSLKI